MTGDSVLQVEQYTEYGKKKWYIYRKGKNFVHATNC